MRLDRGASHKLTRQFGFVWEARRDCLPLTRIQPSVLSVLRVLVLFTDSAGSSNGICLGSIFLD